MTSPPVLLVGGALVGAAFLMGCPAPERVSLSRDLVGAFAPDDDRVVLARSTWTTTDPEAEPWADPTAEDFEVEVALAGAGLEDPTPRVAWPDPLGGQIEQSPLWWRPDTDRLYWFQTSAPFIPWVVDLATGEQTEVSLPAALWAQHNAHATFPPSRSAPIPSPDGALVGVFTATRGEEDFLLSMSFFDANGSHQASHVVPWPQGNVNPWTVSPDGYNHPFLWAPDSSGVYVLDCDYAVFVSTSSDVAPVEVTEVPSAAVPTPGGPVSDVGERVVVEDGVARVAPWGEWPVYGPNAPSTWTAYDDVELVPLASVGYCLPR